MMFWLVKQCQNSSKRTRTFHIGFESLSYTKMEKKRVLSFFRLTRTLEFMPCIHVYLRQLKGCKFCVLFPDKMHGHDKKHPVLEYTVNKSEVSGFFEIYPLSPHLCTRSTLYILLFLRSRSGFSFSRSPFPSCWSSGRFRSSVSRVKPCSRGNWSLFFGFQFLKRFFFRN